MRIFLLGILGVTVLLTVSAIIFVAAIGLRPIVERYAILTLHRRLTIGTLRIGWGNPLAVEIDDLRLANASWGSEPEMVRIQRLTGKIDLLSLFGGALRFEKLEIVNLKIILERDAAGRGNWQFKEAVSASPANVAPSRKKRTRSPILIDFQLHESSMTYRTSGGTVLRSDLHELAIRAGGENQPVSLTLDGAYNGTPVKLNAKTQSFAVLRNGSVPFGVDFSASTPTAKVHFTGTMMEPLDFDDVRGQMQIDARQLGNLLNMFGADVAADFPLLLSGDFTRTGDRWRLTDAKGQLATDPFAGALTLKEAGRARPDDIGIVANFGQFNLDPILAAGGKSQTRKVGDASNDNYGALRLGVEAKRGTNFDAQIKAKELKYRAMRFAEFGARARLAAGEVTLSQLTFAFADGTLNASGSAHNAANGSHIVANAAVSGADANQISVMLGAESGQIAGRINGRATLEMTGVTVKEALNASHGHAVLAMVDGRIAHALLEKASTDLRSLVRKDESSARITCLLGVIDLQDGLGTISPFRLDTPGTALIGGGKVDFLGQHVDMTIKSIAASTGIFALDIPLHVSGSFSHLSVAPVIGSSARWLGASASNKPVHKLPADLQQLADRNPCAR